MGEVYVDDDAEIDDDEARPKKRKVGNKAKKKSKTPLIIGISFAALLLVGLVVGGFFRFFMFRGPSEEEKEWQAMLVTTEGFYNEATEILSTVKDADSAKVASSKLEDLIKKMEAFQTSMKPLPPISFDLNLELQNKYAPSGSRRHGDALSIAYGKLNEMDQLTIVTPSKKIHELILEIRNPKK